MSCYCDFDPVYVWDERERVARKTYQCYECNEPIEPGDDYVYISMLWEGQWWHSRICDCCQADWKQLIAMGHCQELGGLSEAIEEAYEL